MKNAKKLKRCRISPNVLVYIGIICTALGMAWRAVAEATPIPEFLCGFGFGILAAGACRLIWEKRRIERTAQAHDS